MLISSQIKPIYKILLNKSTAFNLGSASMVAGERDSKTSISKLLNYYAKQGVLRNIRKGIYVKPEYDPREVATMLYPPCYVSLQYVLLRSGVIFQYDEAITCVSYLSREIEVDGNTFRYSRMKPQILMNWKGIERGDRVWTATPERAFLDLYYLYPNFYFDYPDILDKEKVKALLPIYKNKNLETRVCELLNITDYEPRET